MNEELRIYLFGDGFMTVKLLITAFCNAALAILLYIAERKTSLKKMPYMARQFIIGVLFGLVAVYSSTSVGGVDLNGTIVNVRDASPLCAGLIFGAPAGIISGLIGGIFRYIATFLGISGTYTQLACSVSTILVGFIAAALRKFMFDNKKPTWIYGVGIAMICEIMHMLMIFFTNMNDITTAFGFVKNCTLPMVLGNGIAVGIAIGVISVLSKENYIGNKGQKQISQTFQFWLLICIVLAFAATSIFTSVVQTRVSRTEAETVIQTNLNDVYQDVMDASDENLLDKTTKIRNEYLSGENVKTLAEKYNVIEVNIIDTNGIITDTNNDEYIGYDMASGDQSAEFLVLLEGEIREYIQDYRPTSYDNKTHRKYGGMVLPDGGFLQVGYDARQFSADVNTFVVKSVKNRHIGNSGFIIVCDEQMKIISDDSNQNGKDLSSIGMSINRENTSPGVIFETDINGTPHLCAYLFVEGYYIIGTMPTEEAMYMKTLSGYVNTFSEMIVFAALFVLIYFLIKEIIIKNIQKINISLAQITNGNLDVKVDVRSNEEFASLSDDINSTVTTLKNYIAEASARIDKELEFAKQIQYSSLPTAFPERHEFELYAKMITAKEVGGDFYDFYMINDHTVAFLIADVSGKGIPAAMFMMKAKAIIKGLAESGLEPDEIFTKANTSLCENNEAGMFVTAWLGILDLSTGLLKFANAGHNPPLICKENKRFEYLKARSGMILAGMEGIRYRKNEIRLSPGDRIYLYTDGVTEAATTDNALYGEQRLLNFVNSVGNVNPKELCERIEEDVNLFAGDAPQFDDITMLGLTYRCALGEYIISVIPNDESHTVVDLFAEQIVSKLLVVPKIANKIHIIFDEIYANIVSYSKATGATISYDITDKKLHLTFSDNGIAYDPLQASEPDITLSAEERQIGGLGIFIVKKMAESVEYTRKDERNVLRITLALTQN